MPCYELLAELLPGVRPMLDQVILHDQHLYNFHGDGDGEDADSEFEVAICNFCVLV